MIFQQIIHLTTDYLSKRAYPILGTAMVMFTLLLALQFTYIGLSKEKTQVIRMDFTEPPKEETPAETHTASNRSSQEEVLEKENYKKLRKEVEASMASIEKTLQSATKPNSESVASQAESAISTQETEKQQTPQKTQAEKSQKSYTGRSLYEVFLLQRKVVKEAPPVYKCQGAAQVLVDIWVNTEGKVTKAKAQMISKSSAEDDCFLQASMQSAYQTGFNVRKSADNPQKGKIIFTFLAQ